jgi:hypothetical protein
MEMVLERGTKDDDDEEEDDDDDEDDCSGVAALNLEA